MRNIPFKVWYGGFAKIVLERVLSRDANEKHLSLSISQDLYKRYTEPGRVYHNAYHPWWMYCFAWENKIILTDAQELAILYHDVIYTIGDKENEEKSAIYCYRQLKDDIESITTLLDACDIINDTAQHFEKEPEFRIWESEVVLDLDIMNMSLPYFEFQQWDNAVKKEFSTSNTKGDLEKRLDFLEFFISKKPIMQSESFKGREPLIRDNLHQKIEETKLELAQFS